MSSLINSTVRRTLRTGLPILALAVSLPCSAGSQTFDVLKIAQLGGKGRIQDATHQQRDPQVSAILAAGKDAIPILIDALESTRPFEKSPQPFWPRMVEGDLALIVLSDLFLDQTWKRSTLPELCWDSILQRTDAGTPARDLLDTFVAAHGRAELAKRWRAAWAQHSTAVRWDPIGRFFVVEGKPLATCAHTTSLERTPER